MTVKAGSEEAFQIQVINLAKFHGWRAYHAPDNRPIRAKSGKTYVQDVEPGFPDLVLLRTPELILAELKTAAGRVRPEQRAWLDDFQRVADAIDDMIARLIGIPGALQPPPAFEVYVWRPADLQLIADRLSRPALGPARVAA